ncbi:MAG: adenosylmethionine--8-amino-7-oxononanoate transaminase [Vulcanimicrobiaceae bacterium]
MPSHVWLPFTQMADFDARERTFVAARGTELRDARGRTLFDAISSVWVTIHGHSHPAIVEAIARQAATLDHATALGATNPVAEELAARLAQESGLDYVFFASDGASAIEAALKMALQYWQAAGSPRRTKFAHLTGSYHGDTTGAMSLSDIAVFKQRFGALCFETIESASLADVLARDDVAAIVVEPIVQAAAGLRIVPHAWYAPLCAASAANLPDRPLLVVDEIATGFGRTGTLFAYEQLGLAPDLLCVGKGITGGTLALSATLATRRIYDAFLGETRALRHFFHGHSYAANPIACAAALASLDLFTSEATLAHVALLDAALERTLAPLRAHPLVREIRRAGTMCGIELRPPEQSTQRTSFAWRVATDLYELGHFTRPIGDTIQLVPPLSSSVAELDAFAAALERTLDAVTAVA